MEPSIVITSVQPPSPQAPRLVVWQWIGSVSDPRYKAQTQLLIGPLVGSKHDEMNYIKSGIADVIQIKKWLLQGRWKKIAKMFT